MKKFVNGISEDLENMLFVFLLNELTFMVVSKLNCGWIMVDRRADSRLVIACILQILTLIFVVGDAI